MNNPLFPEDLEGLRKLFPELAEEELKAADERMGRYLALVLEAHDRIRQDPVRYAELHLRLRKQREGDGKESED